MLYIIMLAMKKQIIRIIIAILIISIGIWIFSGPKKKLNTNIQWSIDDDTNDLVPIFEIYYSWDDIQNQLPRWMVVPKNDKWYIADFLKLMDVMQEQHSSQEQLKSRLLERSEIFNISWISQHRFEPSPSRWETALLCTGFKPTFSLEENVFYSVLKQTIEFDEGNLMPSENANNAIQGTR